MKPLSLTAVVLVSWWFLAVVGNNSLQVGVHFVNGLRERRELALEVGGRGLGGKCLIL